MINLSSLVGVSLLLCVIIVEGAIPTQFNWASTGTYANSSSVCAPPMLDQGLCGSCYAFATTATLGATLCNLFHNNQSWLNLSPQHFLNIAFQQNSDGNPCSGGLVNTVMASIPSAIATCTANCSAGCMPYLEHNCPEDDATQASGSDGGSWESTECYGNECVCAPFTATSCAASGPSGSSSASGSTLNLNGWQVEASNTFDFSTEAGVTSAQNWLLNTGPIASGIFSGSEGGFDTYFYSGARCPAYSSAYVMSSDPLFQSECELFTCLWATSFDEPPPSADWLVHPSNSSYYFLCGSATPITFVPVQAGHYDHAVTVVGWTVLNNQSAWIIQNSWGLGNARNILGDHGFFYVNFFDNNGDLTSYIRPGVGALVSSGDSNGDSSSNTETASQDNYNDDPNTDEGSGLGAPNVRDATTPETQQVVNTFISNLNVHSGANHTLTSITQVTSQVVHGILFKIKIKSLNSLTGTHHTIEGSMYRTPCSGGYNHTLHKVYMNTDFAASSNSAQNSSSASTSFGLQLGIGLGVGLLGLVLIVAAAFLFRKRISSKSGLQFDDALNEKLIVE